MNLTSKQRKHLESLAHELDPIVRIGKNGVTPTLIRTAHEALQARELIKVKLLENAALDKHETAAELVAATQAVLVRVIGNIIVLFRQNLERKHRIQLDGQTPPESPVEKKPVKSPRKFGRRPAAPRPPRASSPRPPRSSSPRPPTERPSKAAPRGGMRPSRPMPVDIGDDPFTDERPPRATPKMRSGPRAKATRHGGRSSPGGRAPVRPSTRRSATPRRSGAKPRGSRPRTRRS